MGSNLGLRVFIVFLLLLPLASAIRPSEVTVSETTTVARLVGDTPYDIINQLDTKDLKLDHATHLANRLDVFEDTTNSRPIGKGFDNKNFKGDASQYAGQEYEPWFGFDTIQADIDDLKPNEVFILESYLDQDDFGLYSETSKGDKIYPEDTKAWREDFARSYPLFFLNVENTGLSLPDQASYINALTRYATIIAPKDVRSTELTTAIICNLLDNERIGDAYRRARTQYFAKSDPNDQNLPGLALKSYALYGNPLTKLHVPQDFNDYIDTTDQGFFEWFNPCSDFFVAPSDPIFSLGTSSLNDHTFREQVSFNYKLDTVQEYTIINSSELQFDFSNSNILGLKTIRTHRVPKGSLIGEINFALNDPVELHIPSYPSFIENSYSPRVCFEETEPARVERIITEYDHYDEITVIVYPLEIKSCEEGQFKLYPDLEYTIEYVPSAPLYFDNIEYSDVATPGETIVLTADLIFVSDQIQPGHIELTQNENVVHRQPINSRKDSIKVDFSAAQIEQITNYVLEYQVEDKVLVGAPLSINTQIVTGSISIGSFDQDSTQLTIQLDNKMEESLSINLKAELLDDSSGLVLNQDKVLAPGSNTFAYDVPGLKKETASYGIKVYVDYLNTQRVFTDVIITNHPPVISVDEIFLRVGEVINLAQYVSDVDGDTLEISIPGKFDNELAQDSDIGQHIVEISASDGFLSTQKEVIINIIPANYVPALDDIEDINIEEGDQASLLLYTEDADKDDLVITTDNENFIQIDENWFEWKTDFDDEGTYTIQVTVTDGKSSITKPVTVNVDNKNRIPLLFLEDIDIQKGQIINITAEVYDADGDSLEITIDDPRFTKVGDSFILDSNEIEFESQSNDYGFSIYTPRQDEFHAQGACTAMPGYDWCYDTSYTWNGCTAKAQLSGRWIDTPSKHCVVNGVSSTCYVGQVTTSIASGADDVCMSRNCFSWSSCESQISFGDNGCSNEIGKGTVVLANAPSRVHNYQFWFWERNNCDNGFAWSYAGGGYTGPFDNMYAVRCVDDSDCGSGQFCDNSGNWDQWQCKTDQCAGKQCRANAQCDRTTGNCNCQSSYTNCDGSWQNGCEVNTNSDVDNCGACSNSCSFENGNAACSGGLCQLASCQSGFSNCDSNNANGCEVNSASDRNNCGSCNNQCSGNAELQCNSGACTVLSCSQGFADCNANGQDACEVNLNSDVNNCGACGNVCSIQNAGSSCNSGSCEMRQCNVGFDDCDANQANGCEQDIHFNINNCGACGVTCEDYCDGTTKFRAIGCSNAECKFEEVINSPECGYYEIPEPDHFQVTVSADDGIDVATKTITITITDSLPDNDGDTYTIDVDCNDFDETINPGAEEVADDGIDNDCDGYDLNSQAPIVNDVRVPEAFLENDVLSCTYTYSDDQGDQDRSKVDWYVNGELSGFIFQEDHHSLEIKENRAVAGSVFATMAEYTFFYDIPQDATAAIYQVKYGLSNNHVLNFRKVIPNECLEYDPNNLEMQVQINAGPYYENIHFYCRSGQFTMTGLKDDAEVAPQDYVHTCPSAESNSERMFDGDWETGSGFTSDKTFCDENSFNDQVRVYEEGMWFKVRDGPFPNPVENDEVSCVVTPYDGTNLGKPVNLTFIVGHTPVDADNDGFIDDDDNGDDCDDSDPTVYPGAPEMCDGKNNDCDAVFDGSEGLTKEEGSNVGACQVTTLTCTDQGDWIVQSPGIDPVEEWCDGVDNDCDGEIDEVCTIGPEIHEIKIEQNERDFRIKANITDNFGVDSATIVILPVSGPSSEHEMTYLDDWYVYDFATQDFGDHYFEIFATDTNGNSLQIRPSENRQDYYYDGTYYLADGIDEYDTAIDGTTPAAGSKRSDHGWSVVNGNSQYQTEFKSKGLLGIASAGSDAYRFVNDPEFMGSTGLKIYIENTVGESSGMKLLDYSNDQMMIRMIGSVSRDYWSYYDSLSAQSAVCDQNEIPIIYDEFNDIMFVYKAHGVVEGYVNGVLCHIFDNPSYAGLNWASTHGPLSHVYFDEYWVSEGRRPMNNNGEFFVPMCEPDWQLVDDWSECSLENSRFKTWVDLNSCTNPVSYCYQESADVASDCGGVDRGVYDFKDDGSYWHSPNNVRDSDWNTYAQTHDANSRQIWIDYIKPEGAVGATWKVKDDDGIRNITIPQACFDAYHDKISVIINGRNVQPRGITWRCFDGSSHIALESSSSEAKIAYEEAMWWHYNQPRPVFESCNYCTAEWSEHRTECSRQGSQEVSYDYTNTCCLETGLDSDCNKPPSRVDNCQYAPKLGILPITLNSPTQTTYSNSVVDIDWSSTEEFEKIEYQLNDGRKVPIQLGVVDNLHADNTFQTGDTGDCTGTTEVTRSDNDLYLYSTCRQIHKNNHVYAKSNVDLLGSNINKVIVDFSIYMNLGHRDRLKVFLSDTPDPLNHRSPDKIINTFYDYQRDTGQFIIDIDRTNNQATLSDGQNSYTADISAFNQMYLGLSGQSRQGYNDQKHWHHGDIRFHIKKVQYIEAEGITGPIEVPQGSHQIKLIGTNKWGDTGISNIINFNVNIDKDNDGYSIDVDCNDNNPNVNPGAPETCNGIDDNCNNILDGVEGFTKSSGSDVGQCQKEVLVCNNDGQWSAIKTGIVASAETCDSVDNDCDGIIDEGDVCAVQDADGDGFITECDDNDPTVYPNAQELCDNKDNDCDGKVDEGLSQNYGVNSGQCSVGIKVCKAGAWVIDTPAIKPEQEVCDNLDNDCDGKTDENVKNICGTCGSIPDQDNDGIPDCEDECPIHPGVKVCGVCGMSEDDCNDDDGDGVNDEDDAIKGSNEHIITNIPNIALEIDGSQDLTRPIQEEKPVEIKQGTEPLMEFEFDFQQKELDLTELEIIKQPTDSNEGMVMISNLDLDTTKTVYMDHLTSVNTVCIKDKDITRIEELAGCNGEDEFILTCNNVEVNGYKCEDLGSKFKISGLKHSAAFELDADADNDGFDINNDCDDTDPNINPIATEICDYVDNDCDGEVDENVLLTFYEDSDGDGFGDSPIQECSAPEGYVDNNLDCDDSDQLIHPDAEEVCDNVDNNCDGLRLYGTTKPYELTKGVCELAHYTCAGQLGWIVENLNNYEESDMSCNNIDNDCDGTVNPDFCQCTDGSVKSCGSSDVGACQKGIISCSNGQWGTQCLGAIEPTTEQCGDNIDSDCDGDPHNGCPPPCIPDVQCEFTDEGFYSEGCGDLYCNDGCGNAWFGAPKICSACIPGSICADFSTLDYLGNACGTQSCHDGCGFSWTNEVECPTPPCDVKDWFEDADGDGFGNVNSKLSQCDQPSGYVADSSDCNDLNPNQHNIICGVCGGSIQTFYEDNDGDTYGDVSKPTQLCQLEDGYTSDSSDCDDSDAGKHELICGSCGGSMIKIYEDKDGDGYGSLSWENACHVRSGFSENNRDCDDSNQFVKPDQPESCLTDHDDNCVRGANEDCPAEGSFTSTANNVRLTESFTLEWNFRNAVACDMNWAATKTVAGSQIITPDRIGNLPYDITCMNKESQPTSLNVHVLVRPRSDFDGDNCVGFPDFLGFAAHFNTKRGTSDYNQIYDLDASGEVDFPDFITFAGEFNTGECRGSSKIAISQDQLRAYQNLRSEVCHDGLDNDGDGQIDENCPPPCKPKEQCRWSDKGYSGESCGTLRCSDGCGNNYIKDRSQCSTCRQKTFYEDRDNDGKGNRAKTTVACARPKNYVSNADDCNDRDGSKSKVICGVCGGQEKDCYDFDKDGRVGFSDFLTFAAHADSKRGEPKYNRKYDFDGDGDIDQKDFAKFTSFYGR